MRDRGYRQAKIDLFYSPYSCCANLETTMYLEPQVYPTTHRWSETTQLQRRTCAQVVPHGNISPRRCEEDRLKNQLPHFNLTKRMTRQDTHQGCRVRDLPQTPSRVRDLPQTLSRVQYESQTPPHVQYVPQTPPRVQYVPQTSPRVSGLPQTTPRVPGAAKMSPRVPGAA